ncbi:MAG TPA: thioredoxin domain-containing protein [Pyrinomonadaceae bacterium]|nr:thioredoxin domain-containing protein [Pyrinomonadaceae bacterium]
MRETTIGNGNVALTEHAHTNRLINETSPYLLQHAHNPVDWFPWGDEAFAVARSEQKPLLLSIGYSACHWCHVMEHESFENEAIAKLMNDNFVNIKVDREERPDLDQIYMSAVQMLTQHGGWPMTVFLTPEAVPFYAGTYFPPEDRYNMPGFPRVLISVADAFKQRKDDIAETAQSILSELKRTTGIAESNETFSVELLDAAARGIIKNYDATNGGFGGAPKFPPAMTLEFLMQTFNRTGEERLLDIIRHTCRRMAHGGIYDQLGGGFHRYSTDARWLVPHFEKMLYDNALLSRLYLHYYQLTKEPWAAEVAKGILDYVVREMTDPLGGFYSTQDADSEGVEGKFFVWSAEEIEQLLGKADADLFAAYYNVTSGGNFEGANILNVRSDVEDIARQKQITVDELKARLSASRRRLFDVRENRIKPDRDEKVLTAWNGLMLSSFAEAGAILERDDYTEVAKNNAGFVLNYLRRDGLLLRTYKDGQARLNAYLEDYAFYSHGLLTLFQTSGDPNFLTAARNLCDVMVSEFWDEKEGGFFFTGNSHEQLIVRAKDFLDNATPSGNSVAAEVLLQLALLTGEEQYRRLAVTILRATANAMQRYPSAFGRILCALDFHLGSPKEIVLIAPTSVEETKTLSAVVWQNYVPNKFVVPAVESRIVPASIPLLAGRIAVDQHPTAYVCENFSCKNPVIDPAELSAQLDIPLPAA